MYSTFDVHRRETAEERKKGTEPDRMLASVLDSKKGKGRDVFDHIPLPCLQGRRKGKSARPPLTFIVLRMTTCAAKRGEGEKLVPE